MSEERLDCLDATEAAYAKEGRPVYNEKWTPTENLYFAVFGERPDYDCPGSAVEMLAEIFVEQFNTPAVNTFFGLGCEKVEAEDINNEAWEEIIEAIENAEDEMGNVFFALYYDPDSINFWGDVVSAVYGNYGNQVDYVLVHILAELATIAQRKDIALKKLIADFQGMTVN